MAYFANGTEGLMYQESYCFRCEHWEQRPGESAEGCPIWDAHLLYAYELCNEDNHPGKVILDMLIPEREHTFSDGITHSVPAECRLFKLKQALFAQAATNDGEDEPATIGKVS